MNTEQGTQNTGYRIRNLEYERRASVMVPAEGSKFESHCPPGQIPSTRIKLIIVFTGNHVYAYSRSRIGSNSRLPYRVFCIPCSVFSEAPGLSFARSVLRLTCALDVAGRGLCHRRERTSPGHAGTPWDIFVGESLRSFLELHSEGQRDGLPCPS